MKYGMHLQVLQRVGRTLTKDSTANCDPCDRRILNPHLVQQFEPGALGHHEVANNRIRLPFQKHIKSAGNRLGCPKLEAFANQCPTNGTQEQVLVIH
jgi:hypothetical protein